MKDCRLFETRFGPALACAEKTALGASFASFASFVRWSIALGFLIALVLSEACAPGDSKDVMVAWSLFDGRPCTDTAIAKVNLHLEGGAQVGTTASDICHALAGANRIPLHGVRAGAQLQAQALSAEQAVLYRAELTIPDPVPALISLPLYYTGGD